MELWRISNYRSLSGEGGVRYAARWHTGGRPVVYLAASPAGAMVEVLVHLELDERSLPPLYTLLRVEVPDTLAVTTLATVQRGVYKGSLPNSRRLGDAWLAGGATALARVPSAILPGTWNFLLKPLHPEAKKVVVSAATKHRFDARLLRQD